MDTFDWTLPGSLVSDDVGVSDQFVLHGDDFVLSPTVNDRWVNPREGKCSANNNTCTAYATKASRGTPTPLCAGHARGADK